MQVKSFMFNMILSELEDAVGVENVSTSEVEKLPIPWIISGSAACGRIAVQRVVG